MEARLTCQPLTFQMAEQVERVDAAGAEVRTAGVARVLRGGCAGLIRRESRERRDIE
jgi:hypothetical protein